MGMGSIQWADQDAYRYYLVTWGPASQGDENPAWGFASISEIIDKMASQAYYASLGEPDDDVIAVLRLTAYGTVPVRIKTARVEIEGQAWADVTFTWQSPEIRGKAGRRSETGSYRIREV